MPTGYCVSTPRLSGGPQSPLKDLLRKLVRPILAAVGPHSREPSRFPRRGGPGELFCRLRAPRR